MLEEKSWEDFREAGMLFAVNTFLHFFGWALCYDTDTKNMYPARCKYRGFTEELTEEGHCKVATYLKENIDELYNEAFK